MLIYTLVVWSSVSELKENLYPLQGQQSVDHSCNVNYGGSTVMLSVPLLSRHWWNEARSFGFSASLNTACIYTSQMEGERKWQIRLLNNYSLVLLYILGSWCFLSDKQLSPKLKLLVNGPNNVIHLYSTLLTTCLACGEVTKLNWMWHTITKNKVHSTRHIREPTQITRLEPWISWN